MRDELDCPIVVCTFSNALFKKGFAFMRFAVFLTALGLSFLVVQSVEAAPEKSCFPLPEGWGGIFPSAKIVKADGKKIWRAVVPKDAGNGRKSEFYRSCKRANCKDTVSGFLCSGYLGFEPK